MKLFSVCHVCEFEPKPYDGAREFGDFDRCQKCSSIMDVWTESGVRNESNRLGRHIPVPVSGVCK